MSEKRKGTFGKTFTKISLVFSAVLLIVWCILGATSTLAWFTDTTPDTVNHFLVGELKLKLSHKVDVGGGNFEYQPVDETVKVFDDEALYEPGYNQVVYLRVENAGNVDFDYRMSITIDDVIYGTNASGNPIYLPDYLKFGVVFGDSEAELNRQLSKQTATLDLTDFSQTSSLDVEGKEYAALILYMPEEVGNDANYRGEDVPTIHLGVTVNASQRGTLS